MFKRVLIVKLLEVKRNCKFALVVPFAERYDSQIFPHALLGHTVLFNLHRLCLV